MKHRIFYNETKIGSITPGRNVAIDELFEDWITYMASIVPEGHEFVAKVFSKKNPAKFLLVSSRGRVRVATVTNEFCPTRFVVSIEETER